MTWTCRCPPQDIGLLGLLMTRKPSVIFTVIVVRVIADGRATKIDMVACSSPTYRLPLLFSF